MDIDKLIEELKESLESSSGADQIIVKESSSTISRIASFILGFLAILIIIIFPIIVALEIIYIVFPLFRDKVDQLAIWMDTKGADTRIVSIAFRDAKEAIAQADTIETGRSPLWCYLKIKIVSIYFVFFCLAVVIEGGDFIVQSVFKLLGNFITRVFG